MGGEYLCFVFAPINQVDCFKDCEHAHTPPPNIIDAFLVNPLVINIEIINGKICEWTFFDLYVII